MGDDLNRAISKLCDDFMIDRAMNVFGEKGIEDLYQEVENQLRNTGIKKIDLIHVTDLINVLEWKWL